MAEPLAKGERTEELLREYFLEIGYFVIRGAKFKFHGSDVTDVDLFLYSKSSPFSRQRTIVDIKRKKTPQAIERIFWTKGLQYALGFENAIVATTDNRKDITDFGKKNDVHILDGDFIKRIDERKKLKPIIRVGEEDIYKLLKTESIGDLYGDWSKKYDEVKSILISELNFNTCNKLLSVIRESLEYYITSNHSESSIRLIYMFFSYLLIALDYSIKDIAFKEEDERVEELIKYFRYGQNGFQRTREIAIYLEKVAHINSTSSSGEWKEILKETIESEFKNVRSEILAEYFGKQQNISKLVDYAIRFEQQAYLIKGSPPKELSTDLLSIIGVVCDFLSIPREKIF